MKAARRTLRNAAAELRSPNLGRVDRDSLARDLESLAASLIEGDHLLIAAIIGAAFGVWIGALI